MQHTFINIYIINEIEVELIVCFKWIKIADEYLEYGIFRRAFLKRDNIKID
jgi:hypothetical protein